MMEWIISSSVLIAVVILLRYALRGKLDLRLQYALWAVVLLRLLIPVSFWGGTLLCAQRRAGGAFYHHNRRRQPGPARPSAR